MWEWEASLAHTEVMPGMVGERTTRTVEGPWLGDNLWLAWLAGACLKLSRFHVAETCNRRQLIP